MADNENTANDAAFEEMASETTSKAETSSDLETKLAQLEGELRRANNEVLKSQAEFENFRKRMRREMEEETRYAALPLVSELLPVIDNLQRATQAASQTSGAEVLIDGVKLVVMQFDQALAKSGCTKIEAVGKEFDPHLHMAVMQEPSNEYPAGTVSRELQCGYRMHDRVVRPSQVFVSTGPAAQ